MSKAVGWTVRLWRRGLGSAGPAIVRRAEVRRPVVPCVSSDSMSSCPSVAPYHTQSKKYRPFPFEYHTELELQIEDLTNLGMGVGRVPLPDGRQWVVMVPSVLPGERVLVRIFSNRDSYSEADLLRVLQPSVDRVTPPCPYFESCGGCQYQHMNISAQRRWKRTQVESLLRRIAGIAPEKIAVNEVIGSEDLFHYRSKITPRYDDPKPGLPLHIGFQAKASHVIVDVNECLIASHAINQRYAEMRIDLQNEHSLRRPKQNDSSIPSNSTSRETQRTKKERGRVLLFREADDGYVCTDYRETITETVLGKQFRFTAGEFFQNNKVVIALLVKHVLHHASAPVASSSSLAAAAAATTTTTTRPIRHLVDTYCGSGLFAICGADRFESVFGIEVSDMAINAARANAVLNNIRNVAFECGSSEAIFERIQNRLNPQETAVVVDPPRKGCDEVFLSQLFAFAPQRVVYVSCDPATQARDTKFFLANGYDILDVTPFDLFPQTRHIENVITFHRL